MIPLRIFQRFHNYFYQKFNPKISTGIAHGTPPEISFGISLVISVEISNAFFITPTEISHEFSKEIHSGFFQGLLWKFSQNFLHGFLQGFLENSLEILFRFSPGIYVGVSFQKFSRDFCWNSCKNVPAVSMGILMGVSQMILDHKLNQENKFKNTINRGYIACFLFVASQRCQDLILLSLR